jgi:hypothetical protein
MSKIRKKTPTFDKFEKDDSGTSNYAPPAQIVKIPDGDKGYGVVAAGFNDQSVYFTPGIKSINHDLTHHKYEKKSRMDGEGKK